MALLAKCDWVIEAVTENLAIKQRTSRQITAFLKPGAILTTNTSGLPVASIASCCPPSSAAAGSARTSSIRRVTCGWSEIISATGHRSGGHGGAFRLFRSEPGKDGRPRPGHSEFHRQPHRHLLHTRTSCSCRKKSLTVEEVDALTGTALGLPRTGTFRLADMVGLDILSHVAPNFAQSRAGEATELPPFLKPCSSAIGWATRPAGLLQEGKRRGRQRCSSRARLADTRYRAIDRAPNCRRWIWQRTLKSLPERLRLLLAGDQKKTKPRASTGSC